MVSGWMLLIFIGLSLLKAPIAFSMLIAALVAILLKGDIPITALHTHIIDGINKFDYLAIPFFIMAAFVMNRGGITLRILNFSNILVGWIQGGLAQANVVANLIFAGISGSATADAAGLGAIEVEMMGKAGYSRAFTAALSAVTSVLAPIIPPSIMLVVYGVTAHVSVGRLLIGGVLPGFFIGGTLMAYIYLLSRLKYWHFPPPLPKPKARDILSGFIKFLPSMGAPLLIIGGIVVGIMTPTEAGAAAVLYGVILSVIYRELSFREFIEACKETMFSTAIVMFIIGVAHALTFILTIEQSTGKLMEVLSFLFQNKVTAILSLNLFMLIVGCFVEGMPAMLILIPLILPIWAKLGLDPVHFGLILVFNLLIGTLTPPMCVTLYVVSAVNKIPFEDVLKDTMVFFVPLLFCLFVLSFFPQLTLFLPNLLMGME
jgi:tripartite ATP-independent transporter DctM subunit